MTERSDAPLVSIVVPSYNQARDLGATLRSVLEQDYPRLEVMVIDGGSTDGSVEIIQSYADRLAYWVSEPDRGQVDAINKGLRRVSGEIVAWINSDDLYLPGTVSAAVAALLAHPQAGMVYGDGLLIDSENRLLDRHHYRTLTALDLLCFDVLLQPATFMRRDALEAAGYLSETYDLILDHELWVKIAARHPLLHVDAFWAGERTYPEAKTMANAGSFGEEAERMIAWAGEAPELAALVAANRTRIDASLKTFTARRLIDARRYREALSAFAAGLRLKPGVVLRYWYKVLQALMGALGLEKAFMAYRSGRRSVQHAGMKLVETAPGHFHLEQVS